jgi:hypothetical protein
MEQLKLCTRHPHNKPRREFIDPLSNEELDSCNQCRDERRLRMQALRQEMEDELERILTLEDLEIDSDESGPDQGDCLIGIIFLTCV